MNLRLLIGADGHVAHTVLASNRPIILARDVQSGIVAY